MMVLNDESCDQCLTEACETKIKSHTLMGKW